MAYAGGEYDSDVADAAREAGIVAAVTSEAALSGEARHVHRIGRYPAEELDEALRLADAGLLRERIIPAHILDLKADVSAPVEFHQQTFDMGASDVPMCWVTGGKPVTVHCDYRYAVGDVAGLAGAAAAINGAFFQLAHVRDISNAMLGPVMSSLTTTRDELQWAQSQLSMPAEVLPYNRFVPGNDYDTNRLAGRPLVLISEHGIKFTDYQSSINSRAAIDALLPGVTDMFIGGGWLVRHGHALSSAEMDAVSTRDHADFRRRAWFGIDSQGRPAVGACPSSQKSETVARCLEQVGIVEAVLLDSGFSTSLYYDGQLYVTGHSGAQPSRPVPHMILLVGATDPTVAAPLPDAAALGTDPDAASASGGGRRHRRWRRR
jgi:hypothetical protein